MNRAQLTFVLDGLLEPLYDPRLGEASPPDELTELYDAVVEFVQASTREVHDLVEEHRLVRLLADEIALYALQTGADELFDRSRKLLTDVGVYLRVYDTA